MIGRFQLIMRAVPCRSMAATTRRSRCNNLVRKDCLTAVFLTENADTIQTAVTTTQQPTTNLAVACIFRSAGEVLRKRAKRASRGSGGMSTKDTKDTK